MDAKVIARQLAQRGHETLARKLVKAALITAAPWWKDPQYKWVKPRIKMEKAIEKKYLNSKDFFLEMYWDEIEWGLDFQQVQKYFPELWHKYGRYGSLGVVIKFTAQHRSSERGGDGRMHRVIPGSVRFAKIFPDWDFTDDFKAIIERFFLEKRGADWYDWEEQYARWVEWLEEIGIKPVPFRPGNNKTKQPLGPLGFISIIQKLQKPEWVFDENDDRKESVFKLRFYF